MTPAAIRFGLALAAVADEIQRHEILRLRFELADSENAGRDNGVNSCGSSEDCQRLIRHQRCRVMPIFKIRIGRFRCGRKRNGANFRKDGSHARRHNEC